jgi:hypothetical protein
MQFVKNKHNGVTYAVTSWDDNGNPALHSDLAGTGISAKISRDNFMANFKADN